MHAQTEKFETVEIVSDDNSQEKQLRSVCSKLVQVFCFLPSILFFCQINLIALVGFFQPNLPMKRVRGLVVCFVKSAFFYPRWGYEDIDLC